jgi:predicted secreted acid phosphatase
LELQMNNAVFRYVTRSRALVTAVSAVMAVLVAGGVALATASAGDAQAPKPAPPAQNLDTVKQDIARYYGDHLDATGQHQASDTSPWAQDVSRVDNDALAYLQHRIEKGVTKPALVLDIDDTSLLTYSYGANNDFAYHDNAKVAAWALAEKLPAIQPTLRVATWAHEHGVAVVFVTGRPQAWRDATIDNLRKTGYPEADAIFFEPAADAVPPYLSCRSACTTIEYKSGTRAHLEALGYDVLASIGDQYSDLDGGHADATFKLANPTYYTP